MNQTLDIVMYTDEDPEDWLLALRQGCAELLPTAQVHRFGAVPPAARPRYAVVWAPPAELFAAHAELRGVFTLGAGVDKLVANPAVPANVPIIRVEDSGMAAQMIEYALFAALHRLRHLGAYAAAQREARWAPLPLTRRNALRVGVLGAGVLGAQVADALAEFGFTVTAWSRTPKALAGLPCLHGDAGLADLLSRSDVVVVLLPLTPHTRGLLDAQRLALLPHGATVVNLARGPIIDDTALLAVLAEGRVGHAFLDVFAVEPLPVEHAFWAHPRVTITPHVAAITPPEEAARQIVGKIARLEAGQAVTGVVDRARGY